MMYVQSVKNKKMIDITKLNKDIKKNEPLKKHCSFSIGGPADFFYTAITRKGLLDVLKIANENNLKVFILAGGTNILCGDKGFRGLVIQNRINSFEQTETTIKVSSGLMMPVLVYKAVEADLAGLEKFTGLPGTVGGAVFGNAGCNGVEVKDVLIEAEVLDLKTLNIRTEKAEYFNFEYRKSILRKTDEMILTATFKVKKGVDSTVLEVLKEKLNIYRREKQPSGKTSGSFFKNPSKETSAGMLIDKVGLKGAKVGDAQISSLHANFFMNTGNATANDILELANLAIKKVEDKYNVTLQKEVRLIGEF